MGIRNRAKHGAEHEAGVVGGCRCECDWAVAEHGAHHDTWHEAGHGHVHVAGDSKLGFAWSRRCYKGTLWDTSGEIYLYFFIFFLILHQTKLAIHLKLHFFLQKNV